MSLAYKTSLALLLLAACDTEVSDRPRDSDGELRDNDGAPDGAVDSGTSMCEREAAEISTFVSSHRSCNVHGDCVAIGNCSNADFIAVAASARDEAQRLVDNRKCTTADGPGYYAGCRDHQCELLRAPVSCGHPIEDPLCAEGRTFYTPSFDSQHPSFAPGCYERCDASAAVDPCGAGFHCTTTSYQPCRAPAGALDAIPCAAISAEVSLCLPDADCDVWLSVEFEQRDERYVLTPNTASKMFVVMENAKSTSQTFTLAAWCHGPEVEGVAPYDPFDTCLAGVCDLQEKQTITLAPNERRIVREAFLTSAPSTCNPQGLLPGNYDLSWKLPGITGAKACTKPASQLTVTNTP